MKAQKTSYSDKAGLPPGSIFYIGKERNQKVTFREINYSADHFEENELKEFSDCNSWSNSDSVTSISVIGLHNVPIVESAGEYFGLDPMILEQVVNTQIRSKLEDFDNFLFLSMKALSVDEDSETISIKHLSLVLGKNGLISFQEGETKSLNALKERIKKGKGVIRSRKSDYNFYRTVDILVDNYFVVTEYLTDRLEILEDKVLENPNENVNEEIFEMKRKIAFVKRNISPLKESISHIIKSDSDLLSKSTRKYFRGVYDHLIHLIETLDSQRESVNDFLNLYMSTMSNKMNEVMKVLTIFASIFIPLTFIAGIYGMNFELMPELHWEYGYLLAWGVMLLVVLLLLIYFRRKDWL